MKRFQLATIAALAMTSAFASASPFIVISSGTFNTDFKPVYYTTSETVVAGVSSFPLPSSLSFYAPYTDATVESVTGGIATYKLGSDELKLSFDGGPFSRTASTSSISGTWSFLSGTGVYAGVASGTGTWSASYSTTGTFAQTTFVGDLGAVPEPASLAAVATGLVGLATRRRRK